MKRYLIPGLMIGLCILVAAVPAAAQPADKSGIETTAASFWVKTYTYNWTVDKSAESDSVQVEAGTSLNIPYTLIVNRTEESQVDAYGVQGWINVTGLSNKVIVIDSVTSQIFCQIDDEKVYITPVETTILPEIPSGGITVVKDGKFNFMYSLEFEPLSGITDYHVDTQVYGDNIPQGGGQFKETIDFSLPIAPTEIIRIDEEATLTDEISSCPTGFTCNVLYDGPRTFEENATVSYTVAVANDDAECGSSFDLTNTATLTESDSGQIRSDSVTVTISTGVCPSSGCTYGVGFWKNRGVFGPQGDMITGLLPLWLGTASAGKSIEVNKTPDAVYILSSEEHGPNSNGIVNLYAHLLAAKLNIANGADGTAIADTVEAADAFLASHDKDDWDTLSNGDKDTVRDWKDNLESYNEGEIGPGVCLDGDDA